MILASIGCPVFVLFLLSKVCSAQLGDLLFQAVRCQSPGGRQAVSSSDARVAHVLAQLVFRAPCRATGAAPGRAR